MRNSNWTGTFTATVQDSGYDNGSGSYQGDFNFTIFIPTPNPGTPPAPPPNLAANRLMGTFRCSVKINDTVATIGDRYGYTQVWNGKGAGDIMGSYDPATNTVSLSSWIMIPTTIAATLTPTPPNQLTPGARPQFTVNNTLAPVGDPTRPLGYQPPATVDLGPNAPLGYYLGCALQVIASGSSAGPITLSLNNRGAQTVVQNSPGGGDLGSPDGTTRVVTWTFVLTPPQYVVELDLDTTELNPSSAQLTTPGANKLTSTLTVTVTADGQPDKSRDVNITVCTAIGGAGTDGHLHDSRGDPCDASRPAGQVTGSDGAPTSSYPVTVTTDGTGVVTSTYYPPNIAAGGPYISGTDQITVEVQDPTIQDKTDLTNEQDIITRVPDLAAMPGSADCTGGGTYYFVSQNQHGCMFYGTAAANQAVVAIANEFAAAQIACRDGAAYPATDAGAPTFTTPGEPKPIRITAMSLPWGGLNDLQGNWAAPHISHNSGTQVDLGWHDFVTGTNAGVATSWDTDRVLLLQTIITNYPGATLPVTAEGRDITATQAEGNNAHFHILFAQ